MGRSSQEIWRPGARCGPRRGDRVQHEVLSVRPADHPGAAGQAGALPGGQHRPEEQAGVVPAADLGPGLRGQVQGTLHHGVAHQLGFYR